MGGGWMILIGALVCIAIIGVVVWLVMRAMRNKQALPLSSLPQQQPYQMNQTPPQQSSEMYQDGVKQYNYPQPLQYSQPQQERPLD